MESSKEFKEKITYNPNDSDIDALFNLYVFRPKENFYHLSFTQKLNILEEKINAVNKLSKEKKSSTQIIKNIFVAPEYLFKNLSQSGSEKYYSQEEKTAFKSLLLKLSKNSDIILIPGTVCWKKASKKDSKIYFRNMLYIAYDGKIFKYKKRNPSMLYDYDFTGGKLTNQKFFKEGKKDHNVLYINGIHLGVEVCFDNPKGELKEAEGVPTVNVHIIIADGVPDDEFKSINQPGSLLVKVERTGNYSTVIGQQPLSKTETETEEVKVKSADKTEVLSEDLVCYTFDHVPLKNIMMTSIQKNI